MNMNFYKKYLKYKKKYIELSKKQNGGVDNVGAFIEKLRNENFAEYEELFGFNDKEKEKLNFLKETEESFKLTQYMIDNSHEMNSEEVIKKYSDEQLKKKKMAENDDQLIQDAENDNKLKKIEENDNKSASAFVGGGKGKQTWNLNIANFQRKIATSVGLRLKISSLSSDWNDSDDNSRYGGIIFWHNKSSGIINLEKRIYSIYFLIQDTNKWGAEHFRAQGQGVVHDYLYEQVVNKSMFGQGANTVCSSGFSLSYAADIKQWVIKFSSIYLNSNSVINNLENCGNNGSKMTTVGEGVFIINGIKQWMTEGPRSFLKINNLPDISTNNNTLADDFILPLNTITNNDIFFT